MTIIVAKFMMTIRICAIKHFNFFRLLQRQRMNFKDKKTKIDTNHNFFMVYVLYQFTIHMAY